MMDQIASMALMKSEKLAWNLRLAGWLDGKFEIRQIEPYRCFVDLAIKEKPEDFLGQLEYREADS